jgi:tetratricopeptide (TPR) repeat protein
VGIVRVRSIRFHIVVVLALLVAGAWPARAQQLSDKLTDILKEAQKAETAGLPVRVVELYQKAMAQGIQDKGQLRQVFLLRAFAYERVYELPKAESDYTSAIKITPVDPKAFAERGYFYLRRGRYADALDDFVAGSRLAPGNPLFQYAAGRSLAALKSDQGAAELYSEAIKLNPGDSKYYLSRAEAYLRMKKFREAAADYDQAIRLKLTAGREWFFAYLGRGYARLALNNYDVAVEDLTEALKQQPNDFQALTWRGFAYERKGDRDLALIDYERALRYDPDNKWLRGSIQRLRSS